ncbi:MAG TPA: Ig-like domain-containing protein [Thermoplasmata archaeon]|nr:Ig-like domain-containing protein [Thermoplasmata archaeon]
MIAKLLACLLLATLLPSFAPAADAPLTADAPGLPAPATHTAGPNDTSEYLLGSVAVHVFFLESNGGGEPQSENWTAANLTAAEGAFTAALTWWTAQVPPALLTFVPTFEVMQVSIEPIAHACGPDAAGIWSCPDSSLWINEVLQQKGYAGAGDARLFLNDLRSSQGTDWAVAVFVADARNDTDGMFAPPPGGTAGWTHGDPGGPFLTLADPGAAAGPLNLTNAAAFALGLAFYATDEGNGLVEGSGYLNVNDEEGSACLMDVRTAGCLSLGSRGQLGWQDTDGDGAPDIVDMPIDLAYTSLPPDPNTGLNLTWTGEVLILAPPNLNPRDPGNPVQVNWVNYLSYREGGPWIPLVPDDGVLDGDFETFTLNLTGLPAGIHALEVCAAKTWGLGAACGTDAFTVDFSPPVTAVNQPAFTITNNTALPLTVQATDDGNIANVRLWYSKDAGPWALYATDFSAPYVFAFDASVPGDGVYDFRSIGTDETGNVEAAPVSPDATVIVDTAAPTTTSNALPGWYTFDFSVSFTVDEAATTYFSVDGSPTWLPGSAVPIFFEGVHTIDFYSVDLANNTEAIQGVTVRLDKSSPAAALVPLANLTNNPVASLNWTASDAVSGLGFVEVYYRPVPGLLWTLLGSAPAPPFNWTLPSDGTWEFSSVAQDAAGNREPLPLSVEAFTTLDTKKPNSTAAPLPNTTAALAFTVTANGSDDLALAAVELWYSFNNGSFLLLNTSAVADAAFLVDAGLLAGEGTYAFYSVAVDAAGNREPAPASPDAITAVDATPPSVAIQAPAGAPAWLIVPDVVFEWTMSDPVSGIERAEVKVDGGVWIDVGTLTFRSVAGLTDGPHTLAVRVTDRAGNVGSASRDIQVDTAGPWLQVLEPVHNTTVSNDTVSVRWSAVDNASGLARVELQMDSEPTVDAGTRSNWTLINVSAGRHILRVRAYDVAGLVVEASVEFVVPAAPGGGGGTQAPFNIWPWVILIIVVLVLLLLLLLARKGKRPAKGFEEFGGMHKVPVEAERGETRRKEPRPEPEEEERPRRQPRF